jgi:hypothetical protein
MVGGDLIKPPGDAGAVDEMASGVRLKRWLLKSQRQLVRGLEGLAAARKRLEAELIRNADYPLLKAMAELEQGMEDLRLDVEVAPETVNKAIAEIHANEAADGNKLKFYDEIVDFHEEMKLVYRAERILIAEAHSKAASYNRYGDMPQPHQEQGGSRDRSGLATPFLTPEVIRSKAWRGDKSCQPKVLAADIQPVE